MDPAMLIPTAEVLPAPWWILEFLGMLTLTLHLLMINVVLGDGLTTGAAITGHAGIDKVSFTGSTRAGLRGYQFRSVVGAENH